MKLRIFTFAALAAVLTGCFPARIVTVSPYDGYRTSYATTVTAPRVNTVTTTHITPELDDLSLYLDLQAVGAAFAQSANIQEFESLINNSSYIISNLDLNGDGYVDYLRVVETIEGYAHVFVIQAVLAPNIYQDIASIVVEAPASRSVYVQIIGSPYIYGHNYYLNPVFVTRPPIFDHFYRPGYAPWRSPWYWGHFPPFYKHPAPLHLGHYQAYVRTYMSGHQFCHRFDFPKECHFKDFERISRPVQRNDYGKQHPERSFIERTANIPANGGARVNNASDIRARQNASTVTANVSEASRRTPNATSSATTPASATSSRAAANSSRSAASASANTSSTSSRSASSTSGVTSTTVKSRVRSTGSTETTVRTTSPSGTSTVNRSTGTTTPRSATTTSSRASSSNSSSTRAASSSSSSSRSAATSSSSTRSAGSGAATRSGSTSTSSNSRSAATSSSSTRRR